MIPVFTFSNMVIGEEKDGKSEAKKRGKIATNAHVVPKEHIKG